MEHLPGFRDFCPEPIPSSDAWSADVRRHIFDSWHRTASSYGFREYDGPPLESLELFTAKSGDEIVGQLYNFIDKGDRPVALRPEMTPTLARIVAAHARHYRKPIKWFSIPQLFRYERQQKGRLREHFQLNADIFGESSPHADAELIALLIDSLRALRLTADDFCVRISSRNAWHDFFTQRCPNPDPSNEYLFYQIIDKLDREDPAQSNLKLAQLKLDRAEIDLFIASAQPTPELQTILDDLTARDLHHFVRIDYSIIRGLAYYTGPVFEAFDRQGEFRAIAGGGRYDHLVKLLSGGRVDLPGLGFGLGDVVLTELLHARGLLPTFDSSLDVFFLIEDPNLRPLSLQLVQQLRQAGLRVDYPLAPAKPDKQFKRALDLNPTHLVRLQCQPDASTTALVRCLRSREESIVTLDKLVPLLSGHPAILHPTPASSPLAPRQDP
jgi:histidyl-tRNA synthetase